VTGSPYLEVSFDIVVADILLYKAEYLITSCFEALMYISVADVEIACPFLTVYSAARDNCEQGVVLIQGVL
jgi:hypothetical protein